MLGSFRQSHLTPCYYIKPVFNKIVYSFKTLPRLGSKLRFPMLKPREET